MKSDAVEPITFPSKFSLVVCSVWSDDFKFLNRPRSIYQYSNMAPRLSGQTSTFDVFLYLSLFWKLRDKGNLKNLQFWPESLGAMLEYWYIERGLLLVKFCHQSNHAKKHSVFNAERMFWNLQSCRNVIWPWKCNACWFDLSLERWTKWLRKMRRNHNRAWCDHNLSFLRLKWV